MAGVTALSHLNVSCLAVCKPLISFSAAFAQTDYSSVGYTAFVSVFPLAQVGILRAISAAYPRTVLSCPFYGGTPAKAIVTRPFSQGRQHADEHVRVREIARR